MNETINQTRRYGPTLVDKKLRESIQVFSDKVIAINRTNMKKFNVNYNMESIIHDSDDIIETVREASSNKSLSLLGV